GTGEAFDPGEAEDIRADLQASAARDFDLYDALIGGNEGGLAREQARAVLPASTYTQWYWKVDLHNLFHFLQLRADAHAQYEIRVYAEEICRIVADWVPLAYRAFEDYRLGGAQLSERGLDCVRRMLAGEEVTVETSGMSKGEWREFQSTIAPGK
ncbi:MAG: FAD-dependent thymidylate synthase, partial [Pseudomonadota bacterium]